jgi:hypothetical protein
MTMKKPTTKKVTTSKGATYALVTREPTGTAPCPGDAHSNPHIDHCGVCMPGWGTVATYAPLTPADVKPGVAVPASATPDDAGPWLEAERAGTIVLVPVVEKRKGSTHHYFAWVTA